MIPVSPFGFVQIFILFICPLLGIISVIKLTLLIIDFFYPKKVNKNVEKVFFSKRMNIFLAFFLILNIWNTYLVMSFIGMNKQFDLEREYKDKRSRFILPVDYKFDGFIFPKGTLINTDNVLDNGERHRYLTLTGLEQARFQAPVKIANIWASAIKVDSHFRFLVQLSKDQKISPVYISDGQGDNKIDESRSSIDCKKDQIAEFEVVKDYYPDKNYSVEGWHLLEDEHFKPKLWLFKGCFSAPPIYVERPYPQSKLFDIERMSDITPAYEFN